MAKKPTMDGDPMAKFGLAVKLAYKIYKLDNASDQDNEWYRELRQQLSDDEVEILRTME